MAPASRLPALAACALLAGPGLASGAPSAELLIQHQVPTARSTQNASTYTAGTMRLLNTGDVAITGLAIDLQPGAGILPDMVVDPPDGTPAGDQVGKGLTLDAPKPAGLAATATRYLRPYADGYRRVEVDLTGLAPGATMPFSVDVDPTSIKGSPDTAPAGPVSGAEMAGALVTVRFANGAELSSRLTPVPGTGTDIPNGVTNARAVVPAPAPRPGLARAAAGSSPAVVTNPSQKVVVTGPPGASGVVASAEGWTALAGAPGGGSGVSPLEPNMLGAGHAPVPFTLGSDGTATVDVALTRAAPPAATTTTGMNTVVAWLESGGRPGPMSAPILLAVPSPAPGSIALVDPPGETPGSFARRISGTTGLPSALPLTVSAWVKAPTAAHHQPIVQHGPQMSGDMRGWTLELRSNRSVGFTLNNGVANRLRQFALAVEPDRWTFVAVVASDTGTVAHAWDAVAGWRTASASAISPFVPADTADLLSVGASKGAPSAEFTGLIDDVRIWSVARTQAEVRGDHDARLDGDEPGLAAYHPFDDGSGGAVADLAGANTLFLTGQGGAFPFTAAAGDWSPDTPIADPARAGAPSVTGTLPSAGDEAPSSSSLVLGFSEPMDASSVAAAVALEAAGAPVPVAVRAGAGGRTFTVVPVAPLVPGAAHVLSVAATAADLGGTPLGAGASVGFTAVADAASPADAPGDGGGTEPPPVQPPPVQPPPVAPPPPAPAAPAPAPSAPAAVAPPAVVPAPAVRPALCARYPRLRATLARQLRAATRARSRATTRRARVAATRRATTIRARQKALVVRHRRVC